VGLFAQWIVTKAPAKALKAAGFVLGAKSEARGWRHGQRSKYEMEDLYEGISRLATLEAPALGVWIYDSDIAYIAAVAPGREPALLVLNAKYTGTWPEGSAVDWTPEKTRIGIAQLVDWSAKVGPVRVEPQAIAEVVRKEWTFAEEGAAWLVDVVGLAEEYDDDPPRSEHSQPAATAESVGAESLAGYEKPLPHMWDKLHLGDLVYAPWRELRYVPGLSRAFIGVWDRENPAEPLEVFPRSYRGQVRTWERTEALLMPTILATHDLDRLGGYERTVLAFDQLSPGGRKVRVKEARFVLGAGVEFVGVWDRQRPAGPVERFPLTSENGSLEAKHRAEELMLGWLAANKTLSGLRRWRFVWHDPLSYGLLVEEEPDPAWSPAVGREDGRFFHYEYRGNYLGAKWWLGMAAHSEDDALLLSQGYGPDWRDVPESVPRNLLATFQWVEGQSGA
jgi:hypothetical protein